MSTQEKSQVNPTPNTEDVRRRHSIIKRPKLIKSTGKTRKLSNANPSLRKVPKSWQNGKLIKEDESPIMSDDSIKDVIRQANNTPITKALIDEAREFTEMNKDSIQKQFMDLVAFYNVSQNKAFFFISSAEARLAIDHIKRLRENRAEDLRCLEAQDEIVRHFLSTATTSTISDWKHEDLITSRVGVLAKIKESLKTVDLKIYDSYRDIVTKDPNGGGYVLKDTDIGKDDANDTNNGIKVVNWHPGAEKGYNFEMTLGWLNENLAIIEANNLGVDVLIMNSRNTATIRTWGATVYEEYDIKTRLKRQVFGNIFGAEIYVNNDLEDNQIILGSVNASVTTERLFVNALLDDYKSQ